MIPPRNAADCARTIPLADLVMPPGLGHGPFAEAPEASRRPVLRFLGTSPGGGTRWRLIVSAGSA